MLFLTKDRSLSVPLLEGLLKFWPFANTNKAINFLNELCEVLECCEVQQIEHLVTRTFKRIAKCIDQDHLQLADRAMCLFENDFFLRIVRHYKVETYPVLVPLII